MPITSPRLAFGLYALTIKQDATPTCSDVQTFSKVRDLITDNITSKPYATFEPDFWLLDGNYKFKPTDDDVVHVGLWSLSMSDENGDFDTPPELTITFGSIQDTDGMTLRFSRYSADFASDIDVAYYNASDVLIRTDNYTPTSWEFATGQAVNDFKKIIITFNSTNNPYRYLHLTGVDFGELIYFTSADIKSANVIQEINPLSIELPIDTLNLSIYYFDNDFSIFNPTGIYANLQKNQPLDVYETVNDEIIYIGKYFLSEWKNEAENIINFECVDYLGLLETMPFPGRFWSGATFSDAIEVLLQTMPTIKVPYELDPQLENIDVTGFVPEGTYREALQSLAFMAGAIVTSSRSGVLRIYKSELASSLTQSDYLITSSDKGLSNNSLELKPLIAGVEIVAHTYTQKNDYVELFNGTLTAGTHIVRFNKLAWDLTITGSASFGDINETYAEVVVSSTGTVVIEAKVYEHFESLFSIYNEDIASNETKNIIKISDATLVNPDNVEEVTQRVYDYFQQRYLQSVRLFASPIAPGESATVDTIENQQVIGIAERVETNLSGGFVSDVDIVGILVT